MSTNVGRENYTHGLSGPDLALPFQDDTINAFRLTNNVRCKTVQGVRMRGGRYYYRFLVQQNVVERLSKNRQKESQIIR
jgi:hypothetical protein